MKEQIRIEVFSRQDVERAVSLWNQCAKGGDMVYAPLTEAQFREIFFESVHYSEEYMLAAYDGQGGLAGFTAGLVKRKYLQGETFFNTPGYVTMVLVSPAWRRMGVGTKLLEELERRWNSFP